MRANAEIESQALNPEGNFRPREAAKPTNNKPAGINRNADTKKGPVLGIISFIATIDVPQKKKGDIKSAHSHADPKNSSTYDEDNTDSSFNLMGFFDNSSWELIMHSTSSPVPKHSTSEDVDDGPVSTSDSVPLHLVLKLDETNSIPMVLSDWDDASWVKKRFRARKRMELTGGIAAAQVVVEKELQQQFHAIFTLIRAWNKAQRIIIFFKIQLNSYMPFHFTILCGPEVSRIATWTGWKYC